MQNAHIQAIHIDHLHSLDRLGPLERRAHLIEEMKKLKNFACDGCPGTCCTFEANSMLITPLEAMDIFFHLVKLGDLTPELKENLKMSVEKNKLGAKYPQEKYLRKTYTCPFFKHQELGCPFPVEVKPYGCLGFNSHHRELKDAHHCYSDLSVLEKRHEEFASTEREVNQELRQKFQLLWEKAPIPYAVLDIWNQVEKCER